MKRMTDEKTGCLICGGELVYSDTEKEMECSFCGKKFRTNVACENGHFICDECHGREAEAMITAFCLNTDLKDPIKIAITLMRHPSMHMHGPEHHYLVPAVLITAYYNEINEQEKKEKALKKALSRSEHIKGGFCGTHGTCGAAIGTGIFISVITGSTPLSGESWSLSNRMTATALMAIANAGGPRCCKRDTYLAIIGAVKFLEENFKVALPVTEEFCCEFSGLNRECRKKECPFWCGQSDNLK